MHRSFPILVALALVLLPSIAHTGSPSAEEPPAIEDEVDWIEAQTVKKAFLVVASFGSYRPAAIEARRLALKAGLEARLEGTEVVHGDLSFSRETSKENGWDYPCYVARGRYDDGAYLSIEPSDSYGLEPGFFVVIAASGSEEDVRVAQRALAAHRVVGRVVLSEVYLGCIH